MSEFDELYEMDFIITGKRNSRVETFNGLLAGFDRDVGATIVDKDNPDNYLMCYRRNGIKGAFGAPDADGEEFFFDTLSSMIRSGVLNANELNAIAESMGEDVDNGPDPTSESCAFN